MKSHTVVLLLALAVLAACQSSLSADRQSPDDVYQIYEQLPASAQRLYVQQSDGLTNPVPKQLVALDQLKIGCFGPRSIMSMPRDSSNLGGQCCGVLRDVEAYNLQIEALSHFIEQNGALDFIPRDPYNMSVEHAQQLTYWDSSIQLTSAQQAVFDQAVDDSHHGGPCCCKCWKWHVNAGLAKKLIVDHGWNASQIAQLWDTSSSCGHDHDTNMHEHYEDQLDQTHDHVH